MVPESFFFPTYIGLITEEHRERIGPALWEFLWCISKTTKEEKEDQETLGVVLGGKPISYQEVANELGGSKSTIKRNFERLENEQYITLKRTPYGQIIKVKNSKKFYQTNRAENGTSAKNDTGAKNDTRAKYGQGGAKNEWGGAKNEWGGAKNDHSNKDNKDDYKGDINNASANAREQPKNYNYEQEIVNRYLQLRAQYFKKGGFHVSPNDLSAAEELKDNHIPLDRALHWLEERFKSYEPRHPRDTINSLDYCIGFIFDQYHQEIHQPKAKPRNKKGQEVLPKWFLDHQKEKQQRAEGATNPAPIKDTNKQREELEAFKQQFKQLKGG